jgi:hypothetical protein
VALCMKSTEVIMVEQEKRNVVPWILKSSQHALETCHGPQNTKCVIRKVLIRNRGLAIEKFSSPFFRCVIMALPFTWKNILRENKKLGKFQYFTMQNYNLPKKKSFKRNQTPSRYHNSIINPKFQHKPKYHLSKILT